MDHPPTRRRLVGARLLVLGAALVAAAIVLVPAWILQPFRGQDPEGLLLAYGLRRSSPVVTLALLGVALACAAWSWRSARPWWRKAALALAVVVIGGMTWLSRQNHFEWMFGPLDRPTFAKADDVDFVEDTDMVLGVTLGGESVAYPVRQLAYHHLVHDEVGGHAVVATY